MSSTSRHSSLVHYAAAMAAIEAGKAVLVEKPLTREGREAAELIPAAQTARNFPHGGNVDAIRAG